MVKTPQNELSKAISRRIDEILHITKFSLQKLSRATGIDIQSLNGYHSGKIPITLESILKICSTLSCDFHAFCDLNKKLSLKGQRAAISTPLKRNKVEKLSDKATEAIRLSAQEKREKNKKYRDQIMAIACTTDYFLRPHTLFQMVVDFSADYDICTTTERLKAILQRCIAKGFIKKHESPWDYGIGYHRQKRIWIYFKNEKDLLKDPEKIFGYNWISDSIVV
ncbi:helix-turn-helix domain-containing protein [Sphingobacterium sp. GVS05A]|uniref:helix-turn-helix domain-containing protein n=1 Tax=Sphingobacterium sp. GVS05A TaxID=2862679 RepID=UPI001CBE719A|nr:helix-turn-helix transcriptional regulator [Sphingobacterium sp. GVS05A]